VAQEHGGKRKRAGRPAKPRGREACNAHFDEQASKILPELFETMKTIASGYKVAVYERPRKLKSKQMTDEGNEPIWVYSVPPDKAACVYLIDRAAGKAAVKNPDVADTELILQVGGLMDPDGSEIEEETDAEGLDSSE
jgi:hypothetical protein